MHTIQQPPETRSFWAPPRHLVVLYRSIVNSVPKDTAFRLIACQGALDIPRIIVHHRICQARRVAVGCCPRLCHRLIIRESLGTSRTENMKLGGLRVISSPHSLLPPHWNILLTLGSLLPHVQDTATPQLVPAVLQFLKHPNPPQRVCPGGP